MPEKKNYMKREKVLKRHFLRCFMSDPCKAPGSAEIRMGNKRKL